MISPNHNPTDLHLIHLRELGITVEDIRRNLAACQLYEEAIRHPESTNDIWWGDVNVALDPAVVAINRERAVDLADLLRENFTHFEAGIRADVRAAAPPG